MTVNEKGNLVFNDEELNSQNLSIIENNISLIQTELNQKTTQTNTVIGYLDYANAISLSISTNDTTTLTYTAPANGMFYLLCKSDDRASIAIGKLTLAIGDTGYTRPNMACVPLRKGDVVKYITTNKAYFVKSKY